MEFLGQCTRRGGAVQKSRRNVLGAPRQAQAQGWLTSPECAQKSGVAGEEGIPGGGVGSVQRQEAPRQAKRPLMQGGLSAQRTACRGLAQLKGHA